MFDPSHLPRINQGTIYLGACLIAGIQLAMESSVNHRQIPTRSLNQWISRMRFRIVCFVKCQSVWPKDAKV